MDRKIYNKSLDEEMKRTYWKFISHFVIQRGMTILTRQPQNVTDGDFFATFDGNEFLIEWEAKQVWKKQHRWQGYPTVDVPYRKHKSKADFFIQINRTGNTLNCCNMDDVQASPVIRKDTRNRRTGETTQDEQFFAVPLARFRWYDLRNGTWVPIDSEGNLCHRNQ
jgi:hypothetical protein